jgi:hypothetical protein
MIETVKVDTAPRGVHILDMVEGTYEHIPTPTISDKPRVAFLWKGDEQSLYVRVPKDMRADYLAAFGDCKGLHLLLAEQVWFTPVPDQPYTLCILDKHRDEPMVLGFFPFDFLGGEAPEITDREQRADAAILLPDGSNLLVPLLVGHTPRNHVK